MSVTTLAPAPVLSMTYAERILSRGLDGGIMEGFLSGPRASVVRDARQAYARFRAPFGYPDAAPMLTTPEGQAKLGKSERYALGLTLTPARTLDVGQFLPGFRPVNACPRASAGCESACLNYSGRGAFTPVQEARQVRHAFLLQNPYAAGVLIGAEIRRALVKHGADGVTFRFNVVSDYRLELVAPRALELMVSSGVRVYDYTAWTPADRAPVPGYHLTYSAKESAHTSDAYLVDTLRAGHNVAMAFSTRKGQALPDELIIRDADGRPHIFRVIDGDVTDDRTTDPIARAWSLGDTTVQGHGVIIGLRAKGARGKADMSGFIHYVG